MPQLKIAVVTPEFPTRVYPHRGRSVYQTLRSLQAYAEVRAVCPLPRYPAWLRPKFDHREADLSYSPPEVSAKYFEYPAIPGITRPFNGIACAHSIEPHLRSLQIDVILNFWVYPAGYAAAVLGRKMGVPVVVGSVGSDLNRIPDPLSAWLIKRTLQAASRVIAKSEQLRDRMLEIGVVPEKVRVIPNGCDSDMFFARDRAAARRALGIPPEAELILFVGRMNPTKGIGELFKAFTALAGERANLLLAYVGDGPGMAAIERQVCTAHLEKRVQFAGACSSDKVAQWLAAANLLALPSYAEGCPNAVLEALSSGRPVVTTEVGDLPKVISDSCGLLVPPHDSKALKDALAAALDREWDHKKIAQLSSRSWDRVAQDTLNVCEETLGDRQGRRMK